MYRLYSRISDHEIVLELWGASTHHPDSKFYFSEFQLVEWLPPTNQIIPWIFECASKMVLPSDAYKLAKWGCSLYEKKCEYSLTK